MDIESLLDIKTEILQNRVVFRFTYDGKKITELRMLKTIEMMNAALETLYKDEIKNVCFVFVVSSLEMPTNVGVFKDFASVFVSHTNIIEKKLNFTIIQSDNKIFKLFFSILKMYYQPIKPLYMCEDSKSTENCLISSSERNKTANFSDVIKN